MARDNSFDVVSEVDLAEVKNAVNQAMREVVQRYDFKGTGSKIELNEKDREILLATSNEFTLQSLTAVLEQKLIRRKVSLKALDYGRVEPAAKDTVRQSVDIQMGIPIDKAREIVKLIKEMKLKKVQASIQGDQVRVSGRDRDALQEVIARLREHDFGIDMQFTNYRSS
ncbi:MAG: YajQ family cyclic di-GMP-binding protein [Acidobacteriota bacterium]